MLAPRSINDSRLGDDRVRRPVGRFNECLEGPRAVVFLVFAQGKLVAAQGIPPQRLECALKRYEYADLQAAGVGIHRTNDRR